MEGLDINNTGKSKIVINDTILLFPERYLELYFIDYLETNKILYEINDTKVTIKCKDILSANKLYDKLQELQISITHTQHWYDDLHYLTFKSLFIELDKNDITILLDEYQDEKDLIDKINQLDIPFEYVFVRLNSVSPKDSTPKVESSLKRDVSPNKIENNENLALNIITLIRNSKRCTDTFKLNWEHSLMIREWKNIDPNSEFRCFIYQNRLTAISQYHCYNKYNYYLSPNEVRDMICKFYKDNYVNFIYEDCIMDIIINKYKDKYVIEIVEFNSFGSGISGAALYNWERDENILFNTKSLLPDIRINL